MRTGVIFLLVAATLAAAPRPFGGQACFAQEGEGWEDALFGAGGEAETVKTETADPPAPTLKAPAQAGPKGEKGEAGEAGARGPRGLRGPAGPAGKSRAGVRGAKVLCGATGRPGKDGRNGALAGYQGTSMDLWRFRNGGTRDQRIQWECIREAKRRDAGETRMRQSAGEDIRRGAREGDEKVLRDLITISLLLVLLIAAAFFCVAAAQRRD